MRLNDGDREKQWTVNVRKAIFKLTKEDNAIVITKFPKVCMSI